MRTRLLSFFRAHAGQLLFLAALVLLCGRALARAGGGEGFSGGGGGGGGSGGGGGNGFIIFYLLEQWISFCVEDPVVGIPLTVVGVAVIWLGHRSTLRAVRTQQLRSGVRAMDANGEARAVAELKARDPSFDENAFYGRVNTAFMIIQQAWCGQNMERARPFVSDSIFEEYTLQFQEQRDEGYRDRMDNIQVSRVSLAEVVADPVFDTVTVCIEASATDYHVSLANGSRMGGSAADEPFVEYWTFLRRRGAKTRDKAGLIEGNCPNCGAAIAMNASAICPNCHAVLRSGQYDWVLAEITQESEWSAEQPRDLPGVAALRQTDPLFTTAELEDAVSVMFWRKAMANRTGNINLLRKVATPAYCQTYEKQLTQPDAQGNRHIVSDCAVGSVRTLGVSPEAARTLALVEVRWSGKQRVVKVGQAAGQGAAGGGDGQGVVGHTLYVAMRKAGVKTNPDMSISSAHCPNCGAPITDDAANTCPYCGVVLNDGSRAWALSDVLSMNSNEAQRYLGALNDSALLNATVADMGGAGASTSVPGAPPIPAAAAVVTPTPEASGLIAWMVSAVAGQNDADPREQSMLAHAAANRGIGEERLKIMFSAAQAGQLQVPKPVDTAQAQQWLAAMANAALADGGMDNQEYRLLMAVGQRYRLSSYDVNLLIRREKIALMEAGKNAKAELRQRGAVGGVG